MENFVKKEMEELERVDAEVFKKQEKFPLILVQALIGITGRKACAGGYIRQM